MWKNVFGSPGRIVLSVLSGEGGREEVRVEGVLLKYAILVLPLATRWPKALKILKLLSSKCTWSGPHQLTVSRTASSMHLEAHRIGHLSRPALLGQHFRDEVLWRWMICKVCQVLFVRGQ